MRVAFTFSSAKPRSVGDGATDFMRFMPTVPGEGGEKLRRISFCPTILKCLVIYGNNWLVLLPLFWDGCYLIESGGALDLLVNSCEKMPGKWFINRRIL
jgi:hypothetical protein